jgi:predicted AAA+ superfamily ATPase
MVHLEIQSIIENQLFQGKVIIIYGPRRVGKTTLSRNILANREKSRYINCELLENKTALQTTNSSDLKGFLGNYQ